MSRALKDPSNEPRDYGATSSSAAGIITSTSASNLPDVRFSGFSPTEFMSLSEDIGNNISFVNGSTKQLEKILKLIGTPREQSSLRDKVHNINGMSNDRIAATTRDLQRLTSLVKKADKQQKLQLEKLTTDFSLVIEKYSALQKRVASALRLAYTQNQLAQMQDGQSESDRAELLQRQKEIQAGMQHEQDLLVDRERQINQIEADILDVNAVMRTISKLAQAQGEQIDQIENSIETTAAEVELGREELMKASRTRQSYRRKILIILAIAVIIGLIVTGIIVGKLTS